jgi:PEP-CTERM motif
VRTIQDVIPENPVGVAISNGGQILLSSEFNGGASTVSGVFLFDPQTATYSLVSGGSVGTGPPMSNTGPTGIATEADGTILLNEATLNAVFSIDPTTGNRTILSDATHGSGPTITGPLGILVVPNVPEPSSIALLAIGAFAFGLAALPRRRAA